MAQAAQDNEPVILFTIPEAAGCLKCSYMHVYRLIARGDLRAVDISDPGKKRSKNRVRSDDLAAYIDSRTRTTPSARRGNGGEAA